MFSAATPAKKVHSRASAAVRRSQSRAGSVAATPPPASVARRSQRVRQIQAETFETSNNDENDGQQDDEDGDGSDMGVESRAVVATDGQEETSVLLQTETHAVSRYGAALPSEVLDILRSSDFYTHPATAVLDHAAGYGCLVTRETCFVWSIPSSGPSTSSPTCYAFPVPAAPALSLTATVFSPVPFVALISSGSSSSSREPGFLLVSTAGQICFWSSVTAALSSVDRYTSADISLTAGEVVRALHKLGPTHYLLATSGARLFSLRITNPLSASTASIQLSLLSRSRGMLARVGGLFGGASADPRAGILAITSIMEPSGSGKNGRRVYAVSDRIVQSWRCQDGGAEQFLAEIDIYDNLLESLLSTLGSDTSSALQPEIIDAKAQTPDKLVLLVSYFVDAVASGRGYGGQKRQNSYALVTVENGVITSQKLLSYRQDPDPRPLSTPRLVLSHCAGPHVLVFVQFPDLVLLTTTSTTLPFEETVSLRDSGRDRLLGNGFQGDSTLTLLAASSGLLRLDVNTSIVFTKTGPSIQIDEESMATQTLKNKLDQAVVFGDRAQNPLAFDFKLDSRGDLVSAAERVSKDLLANTLPHLPTIIDLRAQLNDKAARLRFLMTFIQDNSLIPRLSKTSRRHLSWDAEKVQSAIGLWQAQNARMGRGPSTGLAEESLFVQAIEELDLPVYQGEDRIRGFFRVHLDKLGPALEQLLKIQQHRLQTFIDLAGRTDTVYQTAQALCISYKAIIAFRKASSNLYGITDGSQTCLTEPWSSRPALLELLRETFLNVEKIIQDRTRELGSNIDNEDGAEYSTTAESKIRGVAADERHVQRDLKQYLAELADYALAMHQERMAYLQSIEDESHAAVEQRGLLDGYVEVRSHVIQSLVRISRSNVAYDLAERYRDFRSLVILSNDATIGSPQRVQFYIEKYKEDFAFSLYSWYLEQGRLFDLMNQDTLYWGLLSKFLEKSGVKRLSWMQNIAMNKYGVAASDLLEEAGKETRLAEQKLMLSIGKLARVADMTRAEFASSEKAQRAIENIDDRMDVVQSHVRLIDACNELLDPRDLARSAAEQAKACTERLCSRTEGATKQMLQALFEALLTGSALGTEALIDLFTLKDNDTPETIYDYAHALDILVRDKTTPKARLQVALSAIWRRIYLRDNWSDIRRSTSSLSDEAIASSLQSTALFSTLSALAERDSASLDENLVLRPSQAFYTSSAEEESALKTRFSSSKMYEGLHVESVIETYEADSRELRALVDGDGNTRLEELFDEVQRLVVQSRDEQVEEGDAEGDATMDIA